MRPLSFTRTNTQHETTNGRYPATFRWAGVSLALSGVALGAKAWFDFSAGEPPSSGIDLIAWVAAEKFSLSMSNELMIAAAVLLIPGVIGLYASLEGHSAMLAGVGCGILAAVIPLMIVASVFQGRLVFPVYGIEADNPTTAQLVAGLFFGTEHALLLILGIPTILLSLAMRGTAFGRPSVHLGFAAGLADFVGSYPWLLSTEAVVTTRLLGAAWFITIGTLLVRSSRRGDGRFSAVIAEAQPTEPPLPPTGEIASRR